MDRDPARKGTPRAVAVVLAMTALVVAAAVGACTAPTGRSPSSTRTPADGPPTSAPSTLVAGSVEPRPTFASSGPSSDPEASAPSSRAPSPAAAPPGAVLLPVAGIEQRGILGTYTYGGAGSDSPWIGAVALRPIEIRPGDQLRIGLDDGSTIAAWTIRIASSADADGSSARVFGTAPEGSPPVGSIELRGPGKGDWVLAAEITYGGGNGSGAYFWRLHVP